MGSILTCFRRKGNLRKMCCHEDFCIAYESDFIVSFAILNMPLPEKHQPRNQLTSNKADAVPGCTEVLIRIPEAVIAFMWHAGRRETFRCLGHPRFTKKQWRHQKLSRSKQSDVGCILHRGMPSLHRKRPMRTDQLYLGTYDFS